VGRTEKVVIAVSFSQSDFRAGLLLFGSRWEELKKWYLQLVLLRVISGKDYCFFFCPGRPAGQCVSVFSYLIFTRAKEIYISIDVML
jgi:hypothetical protein